MYIILLRWFENNIIKIYVYFFYLLLVYHVIFLFSKMIMYIHFFFASTYILLGVSPDNHRIYIVYNKCMYHSAIHRTIYFWKEHFSSNDKKHRLTFVWYIYFGFLAVISLIALFYHFYYVNQRYSFLDIAALFSWIWLYFFFLYENITELLMSFIVRTSEVNFILSNLCYLTMFLSTF